MSERLGRILEQHCDAANGSPYWLERQAELGFSLVSRIACLDDFDLLGAFDLEALRRRPVTDFMPRHVAAAPLLFAETGGTTGVPATTAYSMGDFHAAFVAPLLNRLEGSAVFRGGFWLWLGPSGPHVIGKAAQRIASITTGADAFAIDFDPRWFRRLAVGSLARTRYMEHLLHQALRIIVQQDVRYLFTTPVVLDALSERMPAREREAIRLVYLGGMAIDDTILLRCAARLPAALFLGGYGNTLFGVCHEARAARPQPGPRRYFPQSERLAVRVVDAASRRPCAYGDRGRLVMYRIDASCLLPLVIERDEATRLAPLPGECADGFGDPRPPCTASLHVDNGIY
ncbi:MAG: hypothetical protein RLW62_22510 [Gammaproteobacteria bacterium]